MTHRNPMRRDLDAANTERRAGFARSRTWIEVYRAGSGPFIQDVTGREPGEVARICSAIEITGGTWEIRNGNPPDMEGRE